MLSMHSCSPPESLAVALQLKPYAGALCLALHLGFSSEYRTNQGGQMMGAKHLYHSARRSDKTF